MHITVFIVLPQVPEDRPKPITLSSVRQYTDLNVAAVLLPIFICKQIKLNTGVRGGGSLKNAIKATQQVNFIFDIAISLKGLCCAFLTQREENICDSSQKYLQQVESV